MSDAGIHKSVVASFDGTKLAVHRLRPTAGVIGGGEGRPVMLLHGLFSGAQMNWIKFGHAQVLADAGFDVIMPDTRALGDSEAPHDPAAYPPNVLVRDVFALVEALGLEDFDLVGFSMGARTATRAAVKGLKPRRLVLAGMGLEGLAGWDKRAAYFLDAVDRFDEVKQGDPAYFTVQFMKTMKVDRVAAKLLLQSVDDTDPDDLAAIAMPTLVLCGDQDRDNGSPHALAEALPQGRHAEVPGTHMSCVTQPELGEAIARYLSE